MATTAQIRRCVRLQDRPTRSLEHRMTVRALRTTAQRIQFLHAEVNVSAITDNVSVHSQRAHRRP